MKSLTALFCLTLDELGEACGVSTDRDVATVAERINREGMGFLTLALPEYGADVLSGIRNGFLPPAAFAGWRKRGGLPVFLRGFLEQVFDARSGRLLDEPSIVAIRSLRQATRMFAKLEGGCSPEREKAALTRYIQTDREVRDHEQNVGLSEWNDFTRMSILLWGPLMDRLTRRLFEGEVLLPKHGPGATADGLVGNQKYAQSEWTVRLEKQFPALDYLIPNVRHWALAQPPAVSYLLPRDERPVKVVLVPKTAKTPRVIAIEPTCMQYAQQALLRALVEEVDRDAVMSRFVSFDDQSPNQEMALQGSRLGDLATIDLSEASDRVSLRHVQRMFRGHRLLRDAFLACRSTRADVPGHGIISLAKYASMGSASTFPLETMVFLTVVFLGMERACGRPFSRSDVIAAARSVRAYGDDLIVPSAQTPHVIEALDQYGLRVNVDKSFWTSQFRESCGVEAFNGQRVTPVMVRRALPRSRADVVELVSAVSLRNQMFSAGLHGVTDWLDKRIEQLIPFPTVEPTSPILGRWTHERAAVLRTNKRLQRPETYGATVVARAPLNSVEGVPALMKWFLMSAARAEGVGASGGIPVVSEKDHLLRSGRCRRAAIKVGWGPIR